MSFVAYGQRRRLAGLGDPAIPGSFDFLSNVPIVGSGPTAMMSPPGATGLAVKGVLTDPTVPSLSPISTINLSYLQPTANAFLEKPLEEVASAVIAALPDSFMSSVATVMGDVAGAIPIVGQALSFITGVIGLVAQMSVSDEQKQQAEVQYEAAACQNFLQTFAVSPTGGFYDKCQSCPADLFYPSVVYDPSASETHYAPVGNRASTGKAAAMYHATTLDLVSAAVHEAPPPQDMSAGCESKMLASGGNYGAAYCNECALYARLGPLGEFPWAFRPALGMALMKVTEGTVFDPYEIAESYRPGFQAYVDASYDRLRQSFGLMLSAEQWQASVTNKWSPAAIASWLVYGGVPPARRALFRAIRRGIQAASKNYATSTRQLTDAGLSLWPLYMDLLTNAYDTGQLNDEFVSYMLSHEYYPSGWDCLQDGAPSGPTVDTRYWFGSAYSINSLTTGIMRSTSTACGDALAKQISDLVQAWRNTSHPATLAGAQALRHARNTATRIAVGSSHGPTQMIDVHSIKIPQNLIRHDAPSKFQPAAGLLGAAAAAAVLYFFF